MEAIVLISVYVAKHFPVVLTFKSKSEQMKVLDSYFFCFLKCVTPFWSITNSLQAQSCPTLCDPMVCSLPGSSVPGILQARILEWVALSFSRRSSQPRDWTWVSRIVGRHFTIWATREVLWSINLAVKVSWKSTFCFVTQFVFWLQFPTDFFFD